MPAHEHACRLSLEGFEAEPHFRYHRSILRNLRARDERLHEELPEELEYFGFFTEVAFCPSRSVAALPPDVPRRCFDKNVLPFIRQAEFNVVISLGREASSLCVEQLVGRREAERVEGRFHGLMFAGANRGPWVITSYHPNARGPWSRAAVADRLYELFDRRGVALA